MARTWRVSSTRKLGRIKKWGDTPAWAKEAQRRSPWNRSKIWWETIGKGFSWWFGKFLNFSTFTKTPILFVWKLQTYWGSMAILLCASKCQEQFVFWFANFMNATNFPSLRWICGVEVIFPNKLWKRHKGLFCKVSNFSFLPLRAIGPNLKSGRKSQEWKLFIFDFNFLHFNKSSNKQSELNSLIWIT